MKRLIVICALVLSWYGNYAIAQADSIYVDTTRTFIIITHDDIEYMGTILKQDSREILIETKEFGTISIPKHRVREMKEINPEELSSYGEYIPEEVFSTRYVLNTNGLTLPKGENYE